MENNRELMVFRHNIPVLMGIQRVLCQHSQRINKQNHPHCLQVGKAVGYVSDTLFYNNLKTNKSCRYFVFCQAAVPPFFNCLSAVSVQETTESVIIAQKKTAFKFTVGRNSFVADLLRYSLQNNFSYLHKVQLQ